MSSAISLQLSAINRRVHRQNHRSVPCLALRSKLLVVRSGDRSGLGSQTKTTLSYTPNVSGPHIEASAKSFETTEDNVNVDGTSELVPDNAVAQPVRAAKIHDFCLGIPFGGLVLSGGIAGFLFTRNPTTLSTGVFFGGALLALSTLSLKIWRQGKSSLPFMLGQAGIAAALIWKNFQAYSMTKKLFPTGFYAVISAAMLCFYSYVMMSGGNPPPKKSKSSVVAAS